MASAAAEATVIAKIQRLTAAPLLDVLFDDSWYLATYPDAVLALQGTPGKTALDHYLLTAALDGRLGTPFFDAEWYLANYPEAASSDMDDKLLAAFCYYLQAGYRLRHSPNSIFDENWYIARYSFDASKYVNGYHHFLADGAAMGYSPSPLFHEMWYRQRYPDVAAGIDHGLLRSGYHDYVRCSVEAERNPCPYFDVEWYRTNYGPHVSCRRFSYYRFLERGAAIGHNPGAYFEELWYRTLYDDVAFRIRRGEVRSAYHHYLYEGGKLERAPTPYFEPRWYLSWYPDAQERVANGEFEHAYEHYLRVGARQGCSPNPYFDEILYLHENPDVRAEVAAGRMASGHAHYLHWGASEERAPSTLFDSRWYVARYPDVRESIANGLCASAYDHFCRYGRPALRDCSPHFNESWYRQQHPEVAIGVARGEWLNGIHHFLGQGLIDGLIPHPERPNNLVDHNTTIASCARRELRDVLKNGKRIQCRTSGDPLISIVLILYNRAELTLRCLRSIARWADVPYEVIVVDNHSQDETQKMLSRVDGVQVLRNDRNLHFGKAANLGAKSAKGKYLLFLNNDSELQVEALSSAVRVLEESSDIGAVCAKIILNNGLLQEAGSFLRPYGLSEQFGRGAQPFASEYMHRRDVPYGSGAFLMTPRGVFLEMGGFDPVFYPAYFEDSDYCLRLWRTGLRVVFNPDSMIVHHETGSARYRRFIYPGAHRNAVELICRHPAHFQEMPDFRVAPVSMLNGNQLRIAQLLVVAEISRDGLEPWLPLIRRHLAQKFFLTIYPCMRWGGDREELEGLGLEEVELVAGRGLTELREFCRQRTSVYKDTILLNQDDDPIPVLDIGMIRQWLPGVRVFASSPLRVDHRQVQ